MNIKSNFIENVGKTVTRNIHKIGFSCKKYAPESLIVVGVVGIVTGTVMACRATVAAKEIKKKRDTTVASLTDKISSVTDNSYTEDDYKKDVKSANAECILGYVKEYAPAITIEVLSIGMVVSSNVILHKRNAALASAYAIIDKSYKAYRNRVANRFGPEVEKQIRYDIKKEEIEKTYTNDKGQEKTKKETVEVVENDEFREFSDYAKIFDETCSGWTKDAEANLAFLNAQQGIANKLLQDRGYLFLNDVYELLGFPKTKAGQCVGWTCRDGKYCDNHVDFGYHDIHYKPSRHFVNGYERSVILDFNVDGVILDYIPDNDFKERVNCRGNRNVR